MLPNVLLGLVIEGVYLAALLLADDFRLDAGARDERRAELGFVAAEQQHVPELELGSSLTFNLIDGHHVVLLNLELLAA